MHESLIIYRFHDGFIATSFLQAMESRLLSLLFFLTVFSDSSADGDSLLLSVTTSRLNQQRKPLIYRRDKYDIYPHMLSHHSWQQSSYCFLSALVAAGTINTHTINTHTILSISILSISKLSILSLNHCYYFIINVCMYVCMSSYSVTYK